MTLRAGRASGGAILAKESFAAAAPSPPRVATTGDLFVLHPQGRSDARLALTGRDLLRLKVVLDRFAGTSGQDDLAEAATATSGKLGHYFAGLK